MLIPLSHLTSWYNLTLEHESIHNAEHLAFLVVGYLFWRQIFGDDPNSYRLHPALQFFYLFLAIPIDTFTGLSLAGATQELFPAYFATHRTWGPSYVTDLHIGGTIMWVVGDTLMLWPMIPVALRWMHLEERRAVRVDRELDAQQLAEVEPGASPISRQVHQLHAHPVGVRAVDELQRRPSEVDRRPAGLDDRPTQLDDTGRRRLDVGDPERKVRQSQLVDRPPGRVPERARLAEGEQLDRRRSPADELRRDGDVGQVHQPGEFGTDLVRLGLLEAERAAIERQRPLQVAHADAEVREDRFRCRPRP